MTKTRKSVVRAIGAFGALTMLAAAALGAEGSGGGTITYVGFHIGDRDVAGGSVLGQDHLRGVVLADDPAVPFHMSAQDCIGATVVGAGGAEGEGAGYCDGIDRDGDVYFLWWRNQADGRTWGFMGGTGKFEALTGGGTTEVLGGSADGRVVLRWDGTWTTKEP
jgi:hypothetical protein